MPLRHMASPVVAVSPKGDAEDGGSYRFSFQTAAPEKGPRVPVVAYVMLVAAVLAVSSAALVFEKLHDVAPLTLAAWRLQLTALLLAPLAAWQFRALPPDAALECRTAWWLLGASGVCLAAHFGAWIWGLQHTSLPHSLLFVSCTPLLIVLGALALRLPISRGEVAGAVVGFAGVVMLAAGAASSKRVTIAGDAASLFGAAAMVGYLHAGRSVRRWMPIFVYAAPVTGTAAILLSLCSLAFEHGHLFSAGSHGVFGYFGSSRHLPYVVYLAVGPGIVGHTGFNTLLRFFPPLIISMALTLEPLVGSVMGWAFGMVAVPGPLTWAGGFVLLGALMYLSYCESVRSGQQQKKLVAEAAMKAALDESTHEGLDRFVIAEKHTDEIELLDQS